MLGLSPPRISQCRNVKVLDEAHSHRRSCRSIGPIFRAGDVLCLRSHSRQRSFVLPNIREWLLPPRRILWRESGSKSDPAEPFAITFAPPREWLRVKDHVPPETELHCEGFKMLSSIQIQQTIYGLDE